MFVVNMLNYKSYIIVREQYTRVAVQTFPFKAHIFNETEICRNPHVSSNSVFRISREASYKHAVCHNVVFTKIACPYAWLQASTDKRLRTELFCGYYVANSGNLLTTFRDNL